MNDALVEFLITAVVVGVFAWFVLWLVRSFLPEIYLPACVVVGAGAVLVMLYQLIPLLRGVTRGVTDPPAVPDATPAAYSERHPA
jgi:hypothetical protein